MRLYLEPTVLVKLFKTELNTEQMIEIIDDRHIERLHGIVRALTLNEIFTQPTGLPS